MPFKLDFQGNWADHPDADYTGFTALYGPLFQTYSPAMGIGIGYLYGAILLLQKILVIYLLGTTVKKDDLVVPDGTSDFAMWSLAVVHGIQAVFLITNLPINERVENVVQFMVTINQGAFFVVIAMGDRISEPGKLMNNLNLAAMAVVMLASVKVQITGMRKFCMKMKNYVKM